MSLAFMGGCRGGQEGALAPLDCKVFYVLVVTAKGSADKLFMHYFHNLSSASGGFASRPPTGASSLDPTGDFRPQTPNFPTPEKFLWAPISH